MPFQDPLRFLPPALVAAVVATGCASGPGARAERPDPAQILSDRLPPSPERCVMLEPAPAAEAAVRIDTLLRDLEPRSEPGWVLFSVSIVENDEGEDRVRLIENGPEEDRDADAIAQAVRANLRREGLGDRRFRLRLDFDGDGVRTRTGRSVDCRPGIIDHEAFAERIQRLDYQGTRAAVYMIEVDTAGQPARFQARESSGDPEFDRLVALIARTTRYHPATVDGLPVVVWLAFPVHPARPPPARDPFR